MISWTFALRRASVKRLFFLQQVSRHFLSGSASESYTNLVFGLFAVLVKSIGFSRAPVLVHLSNNTVFTKVAFRIGIAFIVRHDDKNASFLLFWFNGSSVAGQTAFWWSGIFCGDTTTTGVLIVSKRAKQPAWTNPNARIKCLSVKTMTRVCSLLQYYWLDVDETQASDDDRNQSRGSIVWYLEESVALPVTIVTALDRALWLRRNSLQRSPWRMLTPEERMLQVPQRRDCLSNKRSHCQRFVSLLWVTEITCTGCHKTNLYALSVSAATVTSWLPPLMCFLAHNITCERQEEQTQWWPLVSTWKGYLCHERSGMTTTLISIMQWFNATTSHQTRWTSHFEPHANTFDRTIEGHDKNHPQTNTRYDDLHQKKCCPIFLMHFSKSNHGCTFWTNDSVPPWKKSSRLIISWLSQHSLQLLFHSSNMC